MDSRSLTLLFDEGVLNIVWQKDLDVMSERVLLPQRVLCEEMWSMTITKTTASLFLHLI